MIRNQSGLWKSCIGVVIALTALAHSAVCQDAQPRHVAQAEALVRNLAGVEDNHYGKGRRVIHWDAGDASARTVCSSFVTLLLERTYGWTDDDFKTWMGARDPDAADYHDAVVKEKGFTRIRGIADIAPGDFIAIKYNDDSDDTGHVMLVDTAPEEQAATDPIIPGTTQYAVTVIDSSASGHGPTDTRARGKGVYTGGIGRGTFRLYADGDGKIAGYAWSETKKSVYYHRPERALVVGRLAR